MGAWPPRQPPPSPRRPLGSTSCRRVTCWTSRPPDAAYAASRRSTRCSSPRSGPPSTASREDAKDPMTHPGGDGTPDVREYCLAELAMAQETHALTARSLIADTLDLIHRLPRTWALVQAGQCEPWVARRVAVMTRPLLAETVGLVDRAVARAIAGHAPTTVFSIARAKIIEADPETHAAERERIRHERYVRLSRADEFGYRHLIARVTAGDAAWIDAMVDRVADILTRTHGHDHNHDELRSLALGWLARPVDLLKLLLEHTDPDRDEQTDDGPERRPARVGTRAPGPHGGPALRPVRPQARLPPWPRPPLRPRHRPGPAHPHRHRPRRGPRTRRHHPARRPPRPRRHHRPTRPRPPRPTPHRRLRTPRGHQGPRLDPDRRRRLPLQPPHRHPRGRRLRPQHPLRPHRTTRPDRPPQQRPTPPHDTTAGRPTAATPAAPSAPADTSGRHPTDSATSSTTKAPAGSTTTRPTSSSPHPTASRSTSHQVQLVLAR